MTTTTKGAAMLRAIASSLLNAGNGAPNDASETETWIDDIDATDETGPRTGFGGVFAALSESGHLVSDGESVRLTERGFKAAVDAEPAP